MKMNKFNYRLMFGLILSLILLISNTNYVYAVYTTNVNLGDSISFGVLAGSAITNTGTTNISGSNGSNIGVYPGTSVTEDAGPIILSSGIKYSASEQIVLDAQNASTAAYVDIQGRAATILPETLGGSTLVAGVYASDSGAFGLTGTLTLDAENDPNAVFIFKMTSSLTTASASSINLINGANACRVFWQVGSSATLGKNSNFSGYILALESITATTGVAINGSLLARNRAVTLDTNTIINNACTVNTSTLTIIKNIINDNNGSSIASDFNINVKLDGIDVEGSPASASTTGTTYVLTPGIYVVSEPAHSGYELSFTGDILSNGTVTLEVGDSKTITLINNDIAPITESPDTTESPVTTESALPKTFSDLSLILLLGGASSLIGLIGWYVKRKD